MKLTKVQRDVLARMEAGEGLRRLYHWQGRDVLALLDDCEINNADLSALLSAHYVKLAFGDEREAVYVLTDAGRAALEQE